MGCPEPMVYPLGRSSWPVSSSNPSVSAPPTPHASIARPASYVGTEGGDAHSGPHVCVASTFLTEPSPRGLPSSILFENHLALWAERRVGPFSSQSLVHNRGGEGEGKDGLSGLGSVSFWDLGHCWKEFYSGGPEAAGWVESAESRERNPIRPWSCGERPAIGVLTRHTLGSTHPCSPFIH